MERQLEEDQHMTDKTVAEGLRVFYFILEGREEGLFQGAGHG